MNLDSKLRELLKEGVGPESAVDLALETVPRDELIEFIRPLVLLRATTFQRNLDRNLETEVDRLLEQGEDPIATRKRLSESTFALPDGTRVNWLDATAHQHRARAGWQRHLAGSIEYDADRHEQAAKEIETAGVNCLRELEKILA